MLPSGVFGSFNQVEIDKRPGENFRKFLLRLFLELKGAKSRKRWPCCSQRGASVLKEDNGGGAGLGVCRRPASGGLPTPVVGPCAGIWPQYPAFAPGISEMAVGLSPFGILCWVYPIVHNYQLHRHVVTFSHSEFLCILLLEGIFVSGIESQVPAYLIWIQEDALSSILGPEEKGTSALNASEGGENFHCF